MANAIIIEPLAMPAIFGDALSPTTAANLGNDWIGVIYRSRTNSALNRIQIDMSVATSIDTVAILNSNGAAPYAQIRGASSQAGLDAPPFIEYFAMQAGAVVPVQRRVHGLYQLSTPANYRWFEYTTTDAIDNFEAGRLVLGNKIQFASNFNFGASFGLRDLGVGEFSQQGVWLPKTGARLRTIGLSFSRTTKQEVEKELTPLLERVGNSKFILVVVDPSPNDQRQRRMYFGPLTGNLEAIWNTSNGFEWRANLVSVI